MDSARERLMKDAQLLVNYRDSPWVAEDSATADAENDGPWPGDRAPDVLGLRRQGVGFPVRLFDVFRGTGYVLLFYIDSIQPDDGQSITEIAASIRARYGQYIRPYAIIDAAATADLHEFDALPMLQDTDGSFRRIYHAAAGTAYLIRPDGYIASRCAPVRSIYLAEYMERIFS